MTQPELDAFPTVPRKPTLDEKALTANVIDVARIFGWRVAHFRSVPVKRGPGVVWQTPVQGDGAGFPDLVLVREEVLWIELKVGGNTLSQLQAEWLEALREAGEEAFVWTDSDWFAGVIEARLRRVTTNAA